MATSKKSIGKKLKDPTSLQAATPANPSRKQANAKARKTQDTSGHGYEKPLANYDPTTQSWKMYQDISLWEQPKSLERLPKSGMTRNGVLYRQPDWVPIISEKESSSWPTPTTQEVEHPNAIWNENMRRVSSSGSTHSMGLADAAQMWPTPTANSWGSTGHRQLLDKKVANGTITLQQKKQMTSGNGGKLNPTWVEWLMGFPTGWTDLED
jgi:hypothetical protein